MSLFILNPTTCFESPTFFAISELVCLEFGKDHVHLFVTNCKNYAPCQIVQFLKGFSSRMMRKNHNELFSEFLWGDKFWSEGYFCESCGSDFDKAYSYIENQEQHHGLA